MSYKPVNDKTLVGINKTNNPTHIFPSRGMTGYKESNRWWILTNANKDSIRITDPVTNKKLDIEAEPV